MASPLYMGESGIGSDSVFGGFAVGQRATVILDAISSGWVGGPGFPLRAGEVLPDDRDFISTDENPAAATVAFTLGPLVDPLLSAGHVLKVRARKNAVHGTQIDLRVRLLQGATEVATRTFTDLPRDLTDFVMELTGAEADSITDYTDLNVELIANP